MLGRRVSRTVGSSTTTYVYDDAHIIAECTDGSLTKKYIYGPGMDNPVAMVNVSGTNQTWYYYYTDALGSVRLMTNASGMPVESYTYDPYGQPKVMTGAGADNNWLTEDVATQDYSSIGNRFLFTGREWDSTTQLYYYRFRDYSPTLGRFLQPDPLGYIDSMNLYQYCGNNPVNWIDPWGLLVDVKYDSKTGEVTVTDRDTGETAKGSAVTEKEAGGKGALPPGEYELLQHKANENWYRVDPKDEKPRNDKHEETGRRNFRLHEGTYSLGCITVTGGWAGIDKLIRNTKTEGVWDRTGHWYNPSSWRAKKYGDLTVK